MLFEYLFNIKTLELNLINDNIGICPKSFENLEESKINIAKIIFDLKWTNSIGEARRLINQNAIEINYNKLNDVYYTVKDLNNYLILTWKKQYFFAVILCGNEDIE